MKETKSQATSEEQQKLLCEQKAKGMLDFQQFCMHYTLVSSYHAEESEW